MDTTTVYVAGGALLGLLSAFLLLQPTNLVKWVQKKNYQYEVTFALYMLTPTEKFIFNSILFLTFSMFAIACVVYLPAHVILMLRRTYYYFAGEAALADASRTAASHLTGTASRASEAMIGAATDLADAAFAAAVNTAIAAQEAVSQAKEGLGWS